jgi:serine protease
MKENHMRLHLRRHRVAVASVTALMASTLPLAAQAGSADTGAVVQRAKTTIGSTTDRMIVKYRDTAGAAALGAQALGKAQASASRVGSQLKPLRITAQGAHVMALDRHIAVAEVQRIASDLMAADPSVEYAEPDLVMRPLFTPNDTRFNLQWHYHEATAGINLPAAWDKATGEGVVVAVIDTGFRPHADLAANLLPGFDFISSATVANDGGGRDSDASDPGDFTAAGECAAGDPAFDSSWHGTHVAGTVAAITNNGIDVAGVAFNAKVQPLRALGKCGGFTSDIADAIRWAAGGTVSGVPANPTPARVINLSLGGSGACLNTYRNAIADARSRGAVLVIAAGNEAVDAANSTPANCPGVISVAAVGRNGGIAGYSNFGTGVDLAAPGGNGRDFVLSTINAGQTAPAGDSLGFFQGTSMAAPHVAGVAALMLSVNAALTPDDVETRLKATVRAFPAACNGCGTGLVDANAAVDAALADVDPAPAPAPEPAPAPAPTPAPEPAPAPTVQANEDDDGGGALGLEWLAALFAAVGAAGLLRAGAERRTLRPVPVRGRTQAGDRHDR